MAPTRRTEPHERPTLTVNSLVLRCTLVGSQPPVWRRFRLPGQFTLARLHRALQALYGWRNRHFHEFEVGGVSYTHDDFREEHWANHQDEARFCLSDLPDRCLYFYDLGDQWEIELVVEERSEQSSLPLFLDGENPGPPEDCGGLLDLANLNAILRNPQDLVHRAMRKWAGSYHPDKFPREKLDKAWARTFPSPKPKRTIAPASPTRLDFSACALPIEHYRLEKLPYRVMMLAALLERGRPMTLEEIAERLQRAGLTLPLGLTTLRKAWKQEGIFQLRGDGCLEVYREHPEVWHYEFLLYEALRSQPERPARQPVQLPEEGWLLAWNDRQIWARNRAGGPDQTFRGEDRRSFLQERKVVYAPHVLKLYETLGLQARRETYRYDLMPLELYDGLRQYPAGTPFESFLNSTAGRVGSMLGRLEAYWHYGHQYGHVKLRREEVPVWWNFTPGSRSPLFSVEFYRENQ